MIADKELYLQMKRRSPGDVIYNYYKEKFDETKHKPFLGPQEFMQYLQMWTDPRACFDIACGYYDTKFSIMKMYDKKGQLIALL